MFQTYARLVWSQANDLLIAGMSFYVLHLIRSQTIQQLAKGYGFSGAALTFPVVS